MKFKLNQITILKRRWIKIILEKGQFIQSYIPQEKPYGISFGQWTVRWWQWAYSSPTYINPVADKSGINANINQNGPVWFLAGTFGEGKLVERYCSIPFNKAILFPVINYEINRIERPDLDSDYEMVKHVKDDQDDIINKEIKINDQNVPIFRVKSDPTIFSLYINPDNYFKLKGGNTLATADGYWVFLKSLPKGNHQIYFHGSCSLGTRQITAQYHIEIT
jgi:hypothetical protein